VTEREDNRLVDYLYGEMADKDRRAFEEVLHEDAELADSVHGFESLLKDIRTVEMDDAPGHLDALVMAHARQKTEAQISWISKLLRRPGFSLAVSGACALVLAVLVIPQMSQLEQATSSELAPLGSTGNLKEASKPQAKANADKSASSAALPEGINLEVVAAGAEDEPDFADATKGKLDFGEHSGIKGGGFGHRGGKVEKKEAFAPAKRGRVRAKSKRVKEEAVAEPNSRALPVKEKSMKSARKPRRADFNNEAEFASGGDGAGGGGLATASGSARSALGKKKLSSRTRSSETIAANQPSSVGRVAPRSAPPAPSPAAEAEDSEMAPIPALGSVDQANKSPKADQGDREAWARRLARETHRKAKKLVLEERISAARDMYLQIRPSVRGTMAFFELSLWLAQLEYAQGRYAYARKYAQEASQSRDQRIQAKAREVVARAREDNSRPVSVPASSTQ